MRVISVSTGTATLLGDGSVTFSGAIPDWVSTIPVFKPPRNPILNPVMQEEPQIFEVSFADGYSQRSAVGMNHMRADFQLTWHGLSPPQKDAIRGFFRERGAVHPFFFGLPGEEILMWTCPRWSTTRHQPFLHMVQATFKRCFDPVP